ncbi:enoyl-CoA hydratase/isomerase family protein [Pseudonocardia lutea]|uniref:Enoyl-CoA hydratase/isomerase family protein n=1 Tax=Pseudonocardia lutea TaxID=2172015 RepID=A0ABW1IIQ1_9PSEU
MTGSTTATEPPILLEKVSDGVALITLNRPGQRNAMNRAARLGLVRALESCRGWAKVVVLTGSGPAFCAGVDLKEPMADRVVGEDDERDVRQSTWGRVQDELRAHPAIVVAAVNGIAMGGGVTLINSADLAFASTDARISMPEIGFGLYPSMAGPSTQLRLPAKRAAWMVLTAQPIDGRTATEWGLVNEAVAPEQLMPTALATAERIAGFDAVGLTASKRALWHIPAHVSDYGEALEYGESVGVRIRSQSDAVAQGVAKFAAGERSAGQGRPKEAE